jgi:hypothetical protein
VSPTSPPSQTFDIKKDTHDADTAYTSQAATHIPTSHQGIIRES